MNSEPKSRVLYESLETSFVNFWALLRHLSQRGFVGRVHVELKDYVADVFLSAPNAPPLVHEIDRAAGTDKLEEAALHRLVLRARESPGTISVFEGSDEAVPPPSAAQISRTEAPEPSVESALHEPPTFLAESTAIAGAPIAQTEPREATWTEVVQTSGELIEGVERALASLGSDFASLFQSARLELADDYAFLDPMKQRFQYANSVVTVPDELPDSAFVTGVSEALRRVVDKVATGERGRRVRERVALDLALIARKRGDALQRTGFRDHLDRIAGTKVI